MYNEYFGFHESPFSVTPDPRFFYANPVYLEAYANLRYGVDAQKGFIVVTGEVGTGKTTLLRKLMRDFKSTVHFASIFNTDLTFNDLLRVTLRELDIPTKGKDRLGMVDELNTYLIEQLKRRHVVCLLIDEAQNLTDESLERLRLLSNLETDKQKLLQIVLVGQPELSAKLDKPKLRQLKQRIAIQCKIAPLKQEEVGFYINFRLGVAGYEGKNLFDPEAIQKITLYSKGIPRLINILCDNALVIAFAASQKTVSAQVITEVASDLRLPAEGQPAKANNAGALSPFNSEPDVPGKAANGIPQNTLRSAARLGAGTVLVILFCVTAVFVYDPESFFTPKVNSNDTSSQKVPLITSEKVVPQNSVVMRYGSTVYKIASDTYGANVVLGLDLIKEFNPQIRNLNQISAGQELLLPALALETLSRQQPDGSYRLVVGSFLRRKDAEEFAGRIIKMGYRVVIKANRVANDLLLYRLELEGLKNIDEARQILKNGLKGEWFTFSDNRAGKSQDNHNNATY